MNIRPLLIVIMLGLLIPEISHAQAVGLGMEELQEAVVTANKETGIHSTLMGSLEMPKTILENSPSALGEPDLLKSAQLLPGIQQAEEGFAGLLIRGSGQSEILFLMDGSPIYNVSHLLGLFSSFTPEAVSNVNLYKGPSPARFGGRAAGIVDVRTKDGDMQKVHGSISVGILNDRMHLEGPIIKGKMSFSVSGRFMHSFFLNPVIKLAGSDFGYYFYDLNGKIVWRPTASDKAIVSVYSGYDSFSCDMHNNRFADGGAKQLGKVSEVADVNWGDRIVSMRWMHDFGAGLVAEAYAYFTGYSYSNLWSEIPEDYDGTEYYGRSSSKIKDMSAGSFLEWRLLPHHKLRAGVGSIYHRYSPDVEFLNRYSINEMLFEEKHSGRLENQGWENSLYAEDEWTICDKLSLNAGVRGCWMPTGPDDFMSIEPRLSAKVDLFRGASLKAALGRCSQYVHLLSSSSMFLPYPADMWIPSTQKIHPIICDQASAGLYYTAIPGWEFSAEGYVKRTMNILDYRDGVNMYSMGDDWEEYISMGESLSRGVEFSAEKKVGKATGIVAYTLAKSDRHYADGKVNNGEWFPDRYDRRHDFSIFFNYRFSELMSLSLTWGIQSGLMITVPEGITLIPWDERTSATFGESLSVHQDMLISSRNNYRLPPSHKLNASFNLTRTVRHGESIWSFGLYNAYNAKNANLAYVDYQLDEDKVVGLVVRTVTFLPVLPSANYTFKF